MSCRINQYQDVFFIENKIVLVDYLYGTIDVQNKNNQSLEEIEEYYSKEYECLSEEYKKNKYKLKSDQMTVVLIPSYQCNMECEYCYEGHEKMNSEIISFADAEKIIEYLKTVRQPIEFILLGGEPIYGENLKIIRRFFEEFREARTDYNISCVSNGLEVTDNINHIKQIGISHFQLTLDGTMEIHNKRKKSKILAKNSFEEACKAIEVLLKNDIQVDVRVNIDQDNVTSITKIAELIAEKRWNNNKLFSVYIYPITFSGNKKDKRYLSEAKLFELVLNQLEQIPNYQNVFVLDFHGVAFVDTVIQKKIFLPQFSFCAACGNQIVFDGNKRIYTCWWGANNKEFEIGKFDENHVSIDNEKWKMWSEHSVDMIEECEKCKYCYICGGGCTFKAFLRWGDLRRGNCAEFKEIVQMYLKYIIGKTSTYSQIINLKYAILKQVLMDNEMIKIQVKGNSMEPEIRNGEKVAIYYANNDLKVGDIVLYNCGEILKLHRIIALKNDSYVVKGDNEEYSEFVNHENIIGKVVCNKEKKKAVEYYTEVVKRYLGNYCLIMEFRNSELVKIEVL